MRVSQPGSNPVQNAETTATKKSGKTGAAGPAKPAEKSGAAVATDGASPAISARGKDFARAREVAANAPDTREEKIAELKRRIAAGKYEVDADAVSDRLVNEHLSTMGMG